MNTSNRNNAPARNARPAATPAPRTGSGTQGNSYTRPATRPTPPPAEPVTDANPYPIVEVTEAKAWPLANPTGKTLGFASVTLGGHVVVDDIRVVDGAKGLFIAMPERAFTRGEAQEYKKIVKPISREQLDAMTEAVLAAWGEAVQGGTRA